MKIYTLDQMISAIEIAYNKDSEEELEQYISHKKICHMEHLAAHAKGICKDITKIFERKHPIIDIRVYPKFGYINTEPTQKEIEGLEEYVEYLDGLRQDIEKTLEGVRHE